MKKAKLEALVQNLESERAQLIRALEEIEEYAIHDTLPPTVRHVLTRTLRRFTL